MTGTHSNVYYFPVETAPAPPAPSSTWARVRRALVRGWWRLRATITEVGAAVRHPDRHHADDYGVLLDAPAPRPALRAAPARIIDLAAARVRLRPAAQG